MRVKYGALQLSQLLPIHLQNEKVAIAAINPVVTGWINPFLIRQLFTPAITAALSVPMAKSFDFIYVYLPSSNMRLKLESPITSNKLSTKCGAKTFVIILVHFVRCKLKFAALLSLNAELHKAPR
ncbi:hypothetical protein FF38_01026 [Lucilia cuprina]|uniref:Uncharacterized protein n=1 Tax=Lucilia cuprina TaxID=7375 RepID=A0A0L0CGR2_LUCCU|nr:hypothetical protein FF38_01026 [Lucilia cuprina]